MRFELSIRGGTRADTPLICNSWINRLRTAAPWSEVDSNELSAAQHALIDRIIPRATVLVAHDPHDVDQVFGYAVVDMKNRVLFWLYTKSPFRKLGVAARLMRRAFGNFDEPVDFCYRTPAMRHHIERWNLRFASNHLTEAIR